MTDRTVWKFTPVAHAEDPRWQGRRIAETLFVTAPTPAEAMVTAARWDTQGIKGHVGNESPHNHSAFADEKLYRIDRAGPEEVAAFEKAAVGPVWAAKSPQVLESPGI